MPRLVFSAIASLDGYTADTAGAFDWAMPDEELHAFVNDRSRAVGTYLYGRRMYDTMHVWQDMPAADDPPVIADYAQMWKAADKVVFSSTMTEARTPQTRVEPVFDPVEVRALVDASDQDVSIGGPTIAAAAFTADIVDEVELYLVPVSVGGGTPALPLGRMLRLALLDERRFAGGAVYLRYAVTRSAG
ncbi:dihydrofolate reductase family protein [Leifsonia sp. AG29]|uniref:dihydrofolate reductase family protein n=1 Tax=Leifsonia sp. AG29 TaxID=2598860 RepID=UPI00131B9212|nr:dihydrofolate reductase family protein [Leifsonia sp. AG29]